MLQGVLGILREHQEGLKAAEVISELERRLPPTAFEAADYPSTPGVRRYGKIVRFTTIPPVKAGWIVKNKGIWTITPDGEKALEAYTDPLTLLREGVARYRAWRKSQPVDGDDSTDGGGLDADEPPDSATSTLEEAEERAWAEISQYLSEVNPYEFQDLVAALLRAMGYHVTYTSPPGPDQGLDIIAFTDPLGAEGPRIKVQVKRRADKISVDGVRSFMALLSQQDVGLFISTGGFTNEAEREVRGQEARRISLIDASKLFDLWVEHFDGIPDSDRQLLPLKPVYFLAPG
jgi:restriction system protein